MIGPVMLSSENTIFPQISSSSYKFVLCVVFSSGRNMRKIFIFSGPYDGWIIDFKDTSFKIVHSLKKECN